MSFYENMRGVSKSLIDKFGQTAYLVKNTNPNPVDNTKPWKLGPTVSSESECVIAFLPDNRNSKETKNYKYREVIQKSNTKALAYKFEVEPRIKDTIRRPMKNGDIFYNIDAIDEIQPDDETDVILYKLKLSR